jgi:hypothetical protein
MGLYLCIFDEDEEVDGVEVGLYSDFNALRGYVARELEGGNRGARFPTLMLHSDCDGEWSLADCEKLVPELREIIVKMQARPPVEFASDWQKHVARSVGLAPRSAFESFIDVDGQFVLERMLNLASVALERCLPILFQ